MAQDFYVKRHGPIKADEESDEGKSKGTKGGQSTYEWTRIIHILSKEFQCSWDDVTNWEVHHAYYRMDFLNLYIKEQEAEMRKMNNRR